MVTFMCRNISIYFDNSEFVSSEVSEEQDNNSGTESESEPESGTESEFEPESGTETVQEPESGTESESESSGTVSANHEESESNIDESGDPETSEQNEQTEQEETYITYVTSVSSNGYTENIDKTVIDVFLLGSVIGVLLSLVLFNRIKAC